MASGLPYFRGDTSFSTDSDSPRSSRSGSLSQPYDSRNSPGSSQLMNELYEDQTLDYDRNGRYSWTSSLSSSPSYLSDLPSESINPSRSTSSRLSTYGLLPNAATPTLYTFEKTHWATEEDDMLHDPGEKGERVGRSNYIMESKEMRSGGQFCSRKGSLSLLAIIILFGAIIGLFAGYPIVSAFDSRAAAVNTTSYYVGDPTAQNTSSISNSTAAAAASLTNSTSNSNPVIQSSGVINANAPNISTRALIDVDTPLSAYTKVGVDGDVLELVFSDEFNVDGRTFYPGEDPYWEAVNLHYYATDDLEWEDPSNIITQDGYLAITISKETLADSHNLGYNGGMLQSWNKFCFTGGAFEVAASLPGSPKVSNFWPAVWMMGNLARAGYGSTSDGVWPYTYDACDVGTLKNQTNQGLPLISTTSGSAGYGGELSYLPGQKLSACSCPGSNHPGPINADGKFAGRGAPEIDLFEASLGQVSQSAQWAPFNSFYSPLNATTAEIEYVGAGTYLNTYLGGIYQMATSALSPTIATAYNSTTVFPTYGIEYTPSYISGVGTGVINWLQNGLRMWRLSDTAMAAEAATGISQRPVTGEPMSIIMNVGMSEGFATVQLADTVFPAVMRIDYVRIYQKAGEINIGCDNPLFPTSTYIENNIGAYSNPNYTVWADYNDSVFPSNRLTTAC